MFWCNLQAKSSNMQDDVCIMKEKSCIFVVAKYSFYLKTFNK